MKKFTILVIAVLISVTAGCSKKDEVDETVPPVVPTRQISGSVFPQEVADYIAQGQAPTQGQMSVTYAHRNAPLDLVVVIFDPTGEFQATELSDSKWYGASRCGLLWESQAQTTPAPKQMACITVLTDGVMTTVSGGQQNVQEVASLANAIYEVLAGS